MQNGPQFANSLQIAPSSVFAFSIHSKTNARGIDREITQPNDLAAQASSPAPFFACHRNPRKI